MNYILFKSFTKLSLVRAAFCIAYRNRKTVLIRRA